MVWKEHQKEILITGILLLVISGGWVYFSDLRNILSNGDVFYILEDRLADNEQLRITTRAADFDETRSILLWRYDPDLMTLYLNNNILVRSQWLVKGYKLKREGKDTLTYEGNQDEQVVNITRIRNYNNGLFTEHTVIDPTATFEQFPSKHTVSFESFDQYKHAVTWRLERVQFPDSLEHGRYYGCEINTVNNVKINWCAEQDKVNYVFVDRNRGRLSVYFSYATGNQQLDITVVDPIQTQFSEDFTTTTFIDTTVTDVNQDTSVGRVSLLFEQVYHYFGDSGKIDYNFSLPGFVSSSGYTVEIKQAYLDNGSTSQGQLNTADGSINDSIVMFLINNFAGARCGAGANFNTATTPTSGYHTYRMLRQEDDANIYIDGVFGTACGTPSSGTRNAGIIIGDSSDGQDLDGTIKHVKIRFGETVPTGELAWDKIYDGNVLPENDGWNQLNSTGSFVSEIIRDANVGEYQVDANITVQSLTIDTTPENVVSATLTATDTNPSGNDINYFLSNDGG